MFLTRSLREREPPQSVEEEQQAIAPQPTIEPEGEPSEQFHDNDDDDEDDDGDEDVHSKSQERNTLTWTEKFNLAALVLAYASLISNQTMVVGTSAVVVLSVGGSRQLAPIALAAFFSGSACISLITAPMFQWGGRKFGFLIGISLGIMGAAIGELGVGTMSPLLVILASFPLGAANGIGMYLRFAAVEVVPPFAKASAVTLVLSGGCIAAFAGPESAEGTRGKFGDDLEFLGVFLMVSVFNALNAMFTGVVVFPRLPEERRILSPSKRNLLDNGVTLWSLLMRRQFWIPALIAAFSWAIMAMPMSVVRVAMTQLGFANRLSLLTIELHFVGMFSPGFFTGKLITRFGAISVSAMAVALFLIGTVLSLISSAETSVATWMLALIFMGVGWNFGFASATVLLTHAYADAPTLKSKLEAANDFVMFLMAGAFIFSTGYIYEAGGSQLSGWRTVNFVIVGLIVAMASIVGTEMFLQQREKQPENDNLANEKNDFQNEY